MKVDDIKLSEKEIINTLIAYKNGWIHLTKKDIQVYKDKLKQLQKQKT